MTVIHRVTAIYRAVAYRFDCNFSREKGDMKQPSDIVLLSCAGAFKGDSSGIKAISLPEPTCLLVSTKTPKGTWALGTRLKLKLQKEFVLKEETTTYKG